MGLIYVARRAQRKGLVIPMGQSKKNPSLIFLLEKTDRSELDDLVRRQLDKQGITSESQVQEIVDKAEEETEQRIKVREASKEVRRLMALKAEGKKLMQNGYRKWQPVSYPSDSIFRR